MNFSQIFKKYSPEMKKILESIRDRFKEYHFRTEEITESISGYSRGFTFFFQRKNIEVRLELINGEEVDEVDGINFALMVIALGGHSLTNYRPRNYTPECWVPCARPTQIGKRWKEFEQGVNALNWDDIADDIRNSKPLKTEKLNDN